MIKNLDKNGLKSIVSNYDIFFIDLWGVVHNGIKLYDNAINTLNRITEIKKKYVLLTNAPRPNQTVKNFLIKMGMDKNIFDNVYTSGQAALNYLKKNHSDDDFYHIGPPRDFDLFQESKSKKRAATKYRDPSEQIVDLFRSPSHPYHPYHPCRPCPERHP